MLPVNPEIICTLISLAKRFQVKEDVVIPDPGLSPTSDWGSLVLTNHKDDPVYQEFTAVIEDLEPDQKAAVVALMWIGRGDYGREELEEAAKVAVEESTIPMSDYLLATPLVAEYLEEGLSQFGYNCNE